MSQVKPETMLEYVVRMGPVVFPRNRRALAEAAGIPFSTAVKVVHQEVKNPRADTVQRLFDAIKAKEAAGYTPHTPSKRRATKKKDEAPAFPVEAEACTA